MNVGVFTQPRPKTDIEPAECERVIHGQSLLNEEKLELAAIADRALRHTLVFGQGVKRQAQRAINPIGTEPLPPSEQATHHAAEQAAGTSTTTTTTTTTTAAAAVMSTTGSAAPSVMATARAVF